MSHITRMISGDGFVSIACIDGREIVARASETHKLSPVCSAALGRLLCAASLMGSSLKEKEMSVTIRIKGDGPAGAVIAVGESDGSVRGYIQNSQIDLPLNTRGKLDVSGAVGKNGFLYVSKDTGLGEPYNGAVPLVSGEIAEDITGYYMMSEQIPNICALGVLVDTDYSIKAAGGFLLQLLPGAPEETIDRLEDKMKDIPPLTTMLANGETTEEICRRLLDGLQPVFLAETHAEYRCSCNGIRVLGALKSMSENEKIELLEDEETRVECHFCDKIYKFSREALKKEFSDLKGESN